MHLVRYCATGPTYAFLRPRPSGSAATGEIPVLMAPAAIGRQTQLPYLVIHSRPTASVLRFKLLAETASCGLGTHLAHHRFA